MVSELEIYIYLYIYIYIYVKTGWLPRVWGKRYVYELKID